MNALEIYLIDCENKRRRNRDRPSNEVLTELRLLLAGLEDAPGRTLASSAKADGTGAHRERDSATLGDLDGVSPAA